MLTRLNPARALTFFLFLALLSSCNIARKMDVYVAEQYGNQIPKPKKLRPEISVNPAPSNNDKISKTVKQNKTLPLIIYWKWDYRHTCTLNQDIAIANFATTVNSMTGRLAPKLNGQHLELTVEQVPKAFAIVDKGGMILFIDWHHLFVEPDHKDLIVSYKLTGADSAMKTGRIVVPTVEKNKDVRFAQSWKSSTREYIARYNANVTTMSKTFVTKLMDEL